MDKNVNPFNGTRVTWTATLQEPRICKYLYECVALGNREVRLKLRGLQRTTYPEGQNGTLLIEWSGGSNEEIACEIAESKDCGFLDCFLDTYLVFAIVNETAGLG